MQESVGKSVSHESIAQKPTKQNRGDYRSESDPLQQVIASKKSGAKFQNWLKAKEVNDEDLNEDYSDSHSYSNERKPYNSQQYDDNHYTDKAYRDHKGTNEVNVLHVPSNRSPGFASPETGWGSEDETGEITAATLLSQDQFDSVADSIIARVKGEMGIKTQSSKKQNLTQSQNVSKDSTHGLQSSKSKGLHNGDSSSGSELSSHVCPICGKVMLPPENNPALLIPCGHTICISCCRRVKFCCICSCAVHNTTANIMLEQIITNFHKQQESADRRRELSKSQAIFNGKKYREELQNLETRREILKEESDNIAHSIRQISLHLRDEHEHVEHILDEERAVNESIHKLQQKLVSLQEKRSLYEEKCDEIQQQSSQEKQRLALVKESIKSIEQEMEKLRIKIDDGN